MTTKVSRGSWDKVLTLQEMINKTDQGLAEAIGYKAGSAISKWRKKKAAPVTAGLAAEALLARRDIGQPLPNDTKIIVAKGSVEDINLLMNIADKLKIGFEEV